MRAINGIHLSNTSQDGWDQMLRVVGDTGTVTLLQFQMQEYARLRQNSHRFLHIRVYHPYSLSQDPARWAEDVVRALGNAWDDPLCGVSSGNELNLHHENGDPDMGHQWQYQTVEHYQRVAAWDMAFWRRVDELVPNRKALRVSPAFADGHEPPGYPADGEYTIPEVRVMLEASDLIGIHPYAKLHENIQSGTLGTERYWHMARPFRPVGWEGPHDIGGVVSQYPHKLFLVSETGTFTHSDRNRTEETWRELDAFCWLCAKSGRVVGVTPFIWNSDAAHPQNVMWPNPELRGFLEAAPRYWTIADIPTRQSPAPIPAPLPEPREKPMPKLFPDQFPVSNAPALRELNPWPTVWTQLNDWSLDTDGDQARENNCGAQSIAAALYHLSGMEQSCDVLRETIVQFFGAPKNGYLTTDHLVSYLRRFCSIECQVSSGDATTKLRPLVERSISDGTPLIVLFAWDYERFAETGHFCPVIGYGKDEQGREGCFVHEVYKGGRKFMTWAAFEEWQKFGLSIRLMRRRWDALPRY